MEKICVIGLGYIGLPTASILATGGYKVIGVDVNPQVVKILNAGKIHIIEPDLHTVVAAAVRSKHLHAQTKPAPADVFMICVPTPAHHASKKADLSYVISAAESIVPYLKKGNLVIVESTIPPHTTDEVVMPILAKSGLKPGKDLMIAHCPERVLPGKILTEMVLNHRVIGGLNTASAEAARKLYASFVKGDIFITDLTTAEMVKLVENSYRDVNIAFANEVSRLCEEARIDPWRLIELANKHPRVKILSPGPGVGGHCIAVDPWFLVERYPEGAKLIRQAREVNDERPSRVVAQVLQASKTVKRPVIACLGITYKADIDDTRESPALDIVRDLQKHTAAQVLVSDPYVPTLDGKKTTPWAQALGKANIIVLLVDHSPFRKIPPAKLKGKILIDTRGIWRNLSH